MTYVRRPSHRSRLTFISQRRKGTRKARLRNTQRLREGGAGRVVRPRAWNTLHFSRPRLKSIATALADGVSTGAGVSQRRAFAEVMHEMKLYATLAESEEEANAGAEGPVR